MTVALPERLETERLVLRAPRASDAAHLFASYTQDAEVARYMTWRPHQRLEETANFIDRCVALWAAGTSRPYLLTLPGREDTPLGMLEARVLGHIVDLGYVLARAHWGQGYMPEAVQTLTETALALDCYFRVQATCDVENVPSARTLEKAGFTREARLERYILHPNLGSEPRAVWLWARWK